MMRELFHDVQKLEHIQLKAGSRTFAAHGSNRAMLRTVNGLPARQHPLLDEIFAS
jgi:hypothetical protein